MPTSTASSENKLSNRILHAIDRAYVSFYHDLTVLNPCTLPDTGPAILVCNHVSGLDPLLIQSTTKRMIVWMMAKEYYDLPSLRWVYQTIDAIPVARSGRDMAATRAALRALEDGRIVGIFPEGKIEKSIELIPFQPGVALLAEKSGATVYPAYLDGTQRDLTMMQAVGKPHRAEITFGPPLKPDPTPGRAGLEKNGEKIQAAVERLRRQVHTIKLP